MIVRGIEMDGQRERKCIALSYYRDLPSLSGEMRLRISDIQPSFLGLTFNLGDIQEIGLYRTQLPPSFLARARQLLREANYKSLPRVLELRPGEATVTIGELLEGAEHPAFRSYRSHEVPHELEEFTRYTDTVAEELRKFPFHVLAGEARWSKPQLEAGENLSISVTLRNAGEDYIEIENPLESEHAFSLQVIREAVDEKEEEEQWAELKPKSVLWTPSEKKPKPSDQAVRLDPGEILELTVTKKAYLVFGRHRGALHLTLVKVGSRVPRNPDGELLMDLGPLTITKTQGLWPPWK
jgi:hypothetical protein